MLGVGVVFTLLAKYSQMRGDRARLVLSRHAQSRMEQRSVSITAVQLCRERGRWMRNSVSGRMVLCWNGVLLGARPFGNGVATVMRGSTAGYELTRRPREKEKRKYKDAKHLRWA